MLLSGTHGTSYPAVRVIIHRHGGTTKTEFSPLLSKSSFSPQVWAFTYTQQIIQEELCLSVVTLFPGAPVVLVLCKNGDERQVSAGQAQGEE